MPPKIATFLCITFILFLFWTNRKRKERFTPALWIPFLWMFFAAGRFFDEWLHLQAAGEATAASYREGNPVNAAAFFALIAAGIYVLTRRHVDWGNFFRKNKAIWLYILFCLLSVLWADYPFVVFKRWIKEFGNLVMVLVILTEVRPYEALGALLRRLGYLWLPLSILFIKYYPVLGRSFAGSTQMYTGIALQKNQLGALCLISLIYYGWYFIVYRKADFRFWSINNLVDMVLLLLALRLLHLSQSATSFGCAAVATAIFAASRLMSRKPERILTWGIIAVLLYLGLNAALDVNRYIIHMLGRRENLTNRTEIWAIVKGMAVNPWIGAGYQSFWLGDRLREIWEKTGSQIIQAHDGYLEQYLELGYIGLTFVIAILLSGLVKIRRLLNRDYAVGMLMLCFVVVSVLSNYTEASFYAISNTWLLTILAVTLPPAPSNPVGERGGEFFLWQMNKV
ncbi:MAG: O-antigen ligase family protein [Syntrophobacteraceae bacterium]